MTRKIISIDEDKCTGCGECIPDCLEGALQIIDGKARLVSDIFCDCLGACIGTCPEGAISVIEREAEPYDEAVVMETIVQQGEGVIKAHPEHLAGLGQMDLYNEHLVI
jgi:ferredoxin